MAGANPVWRALPPATEKGKCNESIFTKDIANEKKRSAGEYETMVRVDAPQSFVINPNPND